MKSVMSFGVEVPVDGKIIDAKFERKLIKEQYEGAEARGLNNFITEDDRVLELGGGIGFISTYLSKVLKVDQVLSFEANPAMLPFISQVHDLNGVTNVEVRNHLLFNDSAEMPAEVPFYVRYPLDSSSMERPTEGDFDEVLVSTARISDVIEELDPTIIVCDIEGAETTLFEAVEFKNVQRLYAESHRRKYGGLGMRKFFHDMHRHDFFFNALYSANGQVLFNRLPPRLRGKFDG